MSYRLNLEQIKILHKALGAICDICPNKQRCEYKDGVLACDFYMNNADDFNNDEMGENDEC